MPRDDKAKRTKRGHNVSLYHVISTSKVAFLKAPGSVSCDDVIKWRSWKWGQCPPKAEQTCWTQLLGKISSLLFYPHWFDRWKYTVTCCNSIFHSRAGVAEWYTALRLKHRRSWVQTPNLPPILVYSSASTWIEKARLSCWSPHRQRVIKELIHTGEKVCKRDPP